MSKINNILRLGQILRVLIKKITRQGDDIRLVELKYCHCPNRLEGMGWGRGWPVGGWRCGGVAGGRGEMWRPTIHHINWSVKVRTFVKEKNR